MRYHDVKQIEPTHPHPRLVRRHQAEPITGPVAPPERGRSRCGRIRGPGLRPWWCPTPATIVFPGNIDSTGHQPSNVPCITTFQRGIQWTRLRLNNNHIGQAARHGRRGRHCCLDPSLATRLDAPCRDFPAMVHTIYTVPLSSTGNGCNTSYTPVACVPGKGHRARHGNWRNY